MRSAGGIPYRLEGGREYFRRQEVPGLLSILRATDGRRTGRPGGRARSSAFGCTADELVVHPATGGHPVLPAGVAERGGQVVPASRSSATSTGRAALSLPPARPARS